MVERLGSFAWKLYSASWMLPLKPYMNIAVVSLPLLGLFWFTVTMEKKKKRNENKNETNANCSRLVSASFSERQH